MAWMWEPAAATYALRRLSASDALDALTEMTDLQARVVEASAHTRSDHKDNSKAAIR